MGDDVTGRTTSTGGRSFRGFCALAALVGTLSLAACGEQDIILPGERLDIRGAELGADAFVNEVRAIALPATIANTDWTHRNGGPTHAIQHPALSGTLSPIFSASIGAGDSRRLRITADPVVNNGRIFTLDSESQVVATSTAGQTLWARSVIPPTDNPRDASGGGLATAGDLVFATTGFGEVVALDAESGAELWRQDLDAPGTSARNRWEY